MRLDALKKAARLAEEREGMKVLAKIRPDSLKIQYGLVDGLGETGKLAAAALISLVNRPDLHAGTVTAVRQAAQVRLKALDEELKSLGVDLRGE